MLYAQFCTVSACMCVRVCSYMCICMYVCVYVSHFTCMHTNLCMQDTFTSGMFTIALDQWDAFQQ